MLFIIVISRILPKKKGSHPNIYVFFLYIQTHQDLTPGGFDDMFHCVQVVWSIFINGLLLVYPLKYFKLIHLQEDGEHHYFPWRTQCVWLQNNQPLICLWNTECEAAAVWVVQVVSVSAVLICLKATDSKQGSYYEGEKKVEVTRALVSVNLLSM